MKILSKEFLQLFVETSPNKLSFLLKKQYINSLHKKIIWLKFFFTCLLKTKT